MRRRLLALTAIALLAMLHTGVPPVNGASSTTTSGAVESWSESRSTESETAFRREILGYYVPYDPTSWASLESNAGSIDVVAVQWVTIDGCGRLASDDDQTLKRFAQARGIRVVPSLLTLSGWLNHRILTDPETSDRAVAEIVEYVVAEGYDGFDLDLEAVRSDDRAAYTRFVEHLADALRERGKMLALAVPAKATDTTTGWAGAYDYAALGQHADLITIMAYEFHGAWGAPGPIAPYDGVERVTAFATSQIPPEKVMLGVAFYGFDWNVTSGGARYLGYPEASALSDRYGAPIELAAGPRSATFRYRAPAGEKPPLVTRPPALNHEVTVRRPPPCPVVDPAPTPTPAPRPVPPPDAIQDHEVWFEEHDSAVARLALADRYGVGGVALWRLGHEESRVWSALDGWRRSVP
jgi:spore germination protein